MIPFPNPSMQNMVPSKAKLGQKGAIKVPAPPQTHARESHKSDRCCHLSYNAPPRKLPKRKPTLLAINAREISS